MTGLTPLKKLLMSLVCAFLIIIYVPVACLVGTENADDTDMVLAETQFFEEETTIELIEFTSSCQQ